MERVGEGPSWIQQHNADVAARNAERDAGQVEYPSSPVPQDMTEVSPMLAVTPAPEPTKEDAVASKRGKGRLPYGKGRTTLVEIIASHAHPNQEFNATAVYNWMGAALQTDWRTAYGTKRQTISRITSFLADINTRTEFPMAKSDNATSTYTYKGGWVAGTQLTNIPTKKVSKTVKTKSVKVNLSKTVKPIKALDNYTNVGFTLTNEPLFQHKDTGVVGTLVFAPLG